MSAANDNKPHPQYFDIMTEFGHDKLMRKVVRGLDRRFTNNLWWFLRFEREMMQWEVNYNRQKMQVVDV